LILAKEVPDLMNFRLLRLRRVAGVFALFLTASASAQGPQDFGPWGGGGRGGFGGGQSEIKLVQTFDQDGDGRLNAEERKAARQFMAGRSSTGRRDFGRSRSGFQGLTTPGPKLSLADVKSYSIEPLYDPKVLRTVFLEFENADWEAELSDFYGTDVEVAAQLTVDGKVYRDVGVHFRGNTSYRMVPPGGKKSLNLSLDFVHQDQRLDGYRTLNLLNSMSDPTFLRIILYMQIARDYLPAPKANFVRVVINGESWGVQVNVQQFNSDFTKEFFGTSKGARWKVPGSPRGGGGLVYLGEDPAAYKRIYEIKTKDDPKSWADLIKLCKVLNQNPPEQLEKALEPLLDIDGTLKFLAVDKALINNDGYWTRASDDTNESFRPSEGFGRGSAGGAGVALDPFAGAEDPGKVLLNKLLAVPALRARYLGYIRDIAEKWLTWEKIGPLALRYQSLIAADIETDTHNINSTAAFAEGVATDTGGGRGGPTSSPGMSLKSFVEQRRSYLLSHPEIKKLAGPAKKIGA
jgi:hypothetical protein